MTSAPLDAIPKNFEVGYEDGVWLIASELYRRRPRPRLRCRIIIFPHVYNLSSWTVPEGMSEESPKNLMGVEVVYAENEFVEDIWGLRINKYVDLGTVREERKLRK